MAKFFRTAILGVLSIVASTLLSAHIKLTLEGNPGLRHFIRVPENNYYNA